MAIVAIAPDVMREYLEAHVDADLMYIWAENEVGLVEQHSLAVAGYTGLRRFSGLGDSRAGVRGALRSDIRLDGDADAASRLKVACVIAAWEVSREQLTRETQMRAEAKVQRITKPIGNQDRLAMRRLVEARFGKLPSSEVPSVDYLSSKLEEVESNEPTASKMDEITSMDDAEVQDLTASLDALGKVQISRRRAKGRLPLGAEEFRMKMRLESSLWLFLASKFTNRAWLQGLRPELFSRYADHFLGRKCYEMMIPQAAVGADPVPLRPPWAVVLNYEYACRRRAMELVREDSQTLGAALNLAIADSELKEIHFTSPIALMGRRSNPNPNHDQPTKLPKLRVKGDGKGAGKGGGKQSDGKGGKGADGKQGGKGKNLLANTPDGRQICFAFNSPAGCPGNCGRVHVFRKRGCMGPHGIHACDKP